jgi:methyl-accepting chemotaxis protein
MVSIALVSINIIQSSSVSASFSNVLILFMYIAVMSIYNDLKIISFSAIIGNSILIFSFIQYRNTVFENIENTAIYTVGVFYLITSLLLIMVSRLGNEMVNEISRREIESYNSKVYIEDILKNIKQTIETLSNFNKNLIINVNAAKEISKEITSTYKNVSLSTQNETNNISEISQLISDTNKNIDLLGLAAKNMSTSSINTEEILKAGNSEINILAAEINQVNNIIGNAVNSINELSSKIDKIGEILNLVSSITSETNLLSLNASIEAARAGEAGRGFAIVAQQVRRLADTSKDATENIRIILKEINYKTKEVVDEIINSQETVQVSENSKNKVLNNFEKISSNTSQVINKSKEIEIMIEKFINFTKHLNERMIMISASTENNMNLTDDVMLKISNEENKINDIINEFKELEDLIYKLSTLSKKNIINKN